MLYSKSLKRQMGYVKEKDLFGRPDFTKSRSYDDFPIPEWMDDRMHFTDPNLSMASACVQRFLQRDDHSKWYHVKIYQLILDVFHDKITKAGYKVLPFWCWCDGGDYKHEPHRHMIVVGGKEVEQPYFSYEPIETARDLVHVISTLSGNRFECTLDGHFYIQRALPDCVGLVLAMLWEGGMNEYMDLLQDVLPAKEFNQKMPFHAVEKEEEEERYWEVSVKGFPYMPYFFVLPVPKKFKPVLHEKVTVLHLLNGRKLYFEEDEQLESMDEKEWMRLQVENGNGFCSAIEDERWIPNERHQRSLDAMKTLLSEYRYKEEQLEKVCSRW